MSGMKTSMANARINLLIVLLIERPVPERFFQHQTAWFLPMPMARRFTFPVRRCRDNMFMLT